VWERCNAACGRSGTLVLRRNAVTRGRHRGAAALQRGTAPVQRGTRALAHGTPRLPHGWQIEAKEKTELESEAL
jgi:hypothetical protein